MEEEELIREIIELQRKADRARGQYGLDVWMSLTPTRAQLKSLFFISNQGSTNSKELAAALGVTPTNMTGIADRLVSRTDDTEPPHAIVSGYRRRRRAPGEAPR